MCITGHDKIYVFFFFLPICSYNFPENVAGESSENTTLQENK